MKVGLCACSNGLSANANNQLEELIQVLQTMGIEAVPAPHIFCKTDAFSGTDPERAADLMRFYRDSEISAIYDLSGGDLANGILKYLDYDLIAASGKELWGYSDLTTVINAILSLTGKASVLYQVRNLVWKNAELQRVRYADHLAGREGPLFDFGYRFLQGQEMSGIMAGGNIRCLLKLAGTRFWPDMSGKILFLEAFGGESGQIASLLNQLELTGALEQVNGILLGTFIAYERAGLELSVMDLLKTHIREDVPVAVTGEIGHGTDAKALRVGAFYELKRNSRTR